MKRDPMKTMAAGNKSVLGGVCMRPGVQECRRSGVPACDCGCAIHNTDDVAWMYYYIDVKTVLPFTNMLFEVHRNIINFSVIAVCTIANL